MMRRKWPHKSGGRVEMIWARWGGQYAFALRLHELSLI